jgi:hypothetical protein
MSSFCYLIFSFVSNFFCAHSFDLMSTILINSCLLVFPILKYYNQAAAAEDEKARAAQSEAEAAELVAMQERLQGL